MFRRFFILILFIPILMQAQNTNTPSSASWKKVNEMIEKQHYADADKMATQLYNDALERHDSRQSLIGARFLSIIASEYKENSVDTILARYQELLPNLDATDAAICRLLIARIYSDYYANNQWHIRQNSPSSEPDLDYTLWDLSRFQSVIEKLIRDALADQAMLFSVNSDDLEYLASTHKGKDIDIMPTLNEMALSVAIDIFQSLSFPRLVSSDFDDASLLLATSDKFATMPLKSNDGNRGLARFLMSRLQSTERYHYEKNCGDAMLVNFIINRIDSHIGALVDKDLSSYMEHKLKEDIEYFAPRNSEQITLLYFKLASLYNDGGKFAEAVRYIDEAVRLHPDSPGGAMCYNLGQQIRKTNIQVKIEDYSPSDSYLLGTVDVRNADTIYFRVIAYTDLNNKNFSGQRQKILQQKVYHSFSLVVKHPNDYAWHKSYFSLPPLSQGKYLLVVSTDKGVSTDGFTFVDFEIADVALIPAYPDGDLRQGFLVDRKTGQPVSKCEITLSYDKNDRTKNVVIGTEKTDSKGYYDFTGMLKTREIESYSRLRYSVKYKGRKLELGSAWMRKDHSAKSDEEKLTLYFDRPVYKPGDTVHFGGFLYRGNDFDGNVVSGKKIKLMLKDINYKTIDSLTVTTDSYGQFNGSFVIADDATPGSWHIDAKSYDTYYFKVEAYKQPKFLVTLTKPEVERHFGAMARVDGVAASYTEVPVGGARVSYTVTRKEKVQYWRWNWWMYDAGNSEQLVDKGEIVTDADGLFSVEFIPMPDADADQERRPCYDYIVNVKVTDINGETHEAKTSLTVGYDNSYIELDVENESTDSTSVVASIRNLDGKAIDGDIEVTVSRLRVPEKPKFAHQLSLSQPTPLFNTYGRKRGQSNGESYGGFLDSSKCQMPFTKTEFEKLFPYLDYDGTVSDYTRWSEEKHLHNLRRQVSAESPYNFSLKGCQPGVYKVSVRSFAADGTLISNGERYVVYNPPTADNRKPILSDLINVTVEKSDVRVGESASIRVGSRYDDVTLFMVVFKDEKQLSHEVYSVSKGYFDISIPVTEKMLGGFRVEIAAMKENHFEYESFNFSVPFIHKELKVTWNTFRDNLLPGSEEQWCVEIADKDGKSVDANLLMTMYDISLENYGSLRWTTSLWPSSSYSGSLFSNIVDIRGGWYHIAKEPKYKQVDDYDYSYHYLMLDMPYALSRRYNRRALYSLKSGAPMAKNAMVESDEEVFVVLESAPAGAMYDMVENELGVEEIATATAGVEDGDEKEIQVRQNLNTLAFFKPVLKTTEKGSVTFSFTVPELLTKWKVAGVAWTPQLMFGSITGEAVSRKPLMAVPNVPRFLRHGDTCLFSVKVSNTSGVRQPVTVSIEMTDAISGELLPIVVGPVSKQLELADGRSGEVSFRIAIPTTGPCMVNYKVIARGEGCSDGEQGPIPLLPSRQLVTESMAFYVNGNDVKHFELKHLTGYKAEDPKNTLVHHSLTVDLTPDPLWLAIQSLPYVSRQQNPSNIYLANAVFANSISRQIVDQNPYIEKLFESWKVGDPDAFVSALERNSDLKQTVVEATPWLRDAVSEEQRQKDIANYFDKEKIDRLLASQLRTLMDGQNSDGGWSWISGCSWSSQYTTQYILKTFGQLKQHGVDIDGGTSRAIEKALDYVDRETYKYYEKYLKKSGCEAINLDYLYLISYFPSHKMSSKHKEAYDYFYRNALKHDKEYKSLYSQAVLALVFHRHGDTDKAREMLYRVKQKALKSDEMGMYWRDNISGWLWNERPIETQALLIRAFTEITGYDEDVARMQQWLLKQKQTTSWSTDVSTANAIQALLVNTKSSERQSDVSVAFGTHLLKTDADNPRIHISQRLAAEEIRPSDGKVTVTKKDDGIAWGAIYWQYFENLEKIPYSSMGITIRRTLLRINDDNSVTPVGEGCSLKVGDRVRVRLELTCDRNLEYVQVSEPRNAAMEPVSTASGWRWNKGLSFYTSVTNTALTLYVDRLDKGSYVVEYDMYVNNAGKYTSAPTVVQCLYAPEFRAICPTAPINVE